MIVYNIDREINRVVEYLKGTREWRNLSEKEQENKISNTKEVLNYLLKNNICYNLSPMQVSNISAVTIDIVKYLKRKNVWFKLSANDDAISCMDAARKRNRLGNKGIPIFDELKSELGCFIDKNRIEQKVLVHCRGNQQLDRLKISSILNAEYQRQYSDDVAKGLINPFAKEFRDIIQIFDISTTQEFHPPNTMMTNAGDKTYALEFDAIQLINALPHAEIKDVIRTDNYKHFKKHKIGILTGNGPGSGMLLWDKINNSIKDMLVKKLSYSFMGDLSYPEICIESIPEMGISMELAERLDATRKAVIKSVISLCTRGCSLLCLACNTTQYFTKDIEELCNLYNVQFVSIPKTVEEYLKLNNITEADFIGISYVTDFKKYSAFKKLEESLSISIPNIATLNKISQLAFDYKKDKSKNPKELNDLIVNNTKYSNVIVALTEVSLAYSVHKPRLDGKTLIDSLQLLANAIGDIYVNGIFRTLYIDESKDLIKCKILSKNTIEQYKDEVWKLLCEIDHDFVPPLSHRDSTTFKFESKNLEQGHPEAYFEVLLKQEIIISKNIKTDQVTGFMSYKPEFTIEHNNEEILCQYVTTVGVTKGARGHGITQQFYKTIEKTIIDNVKTRRIATRTWSTNDTHIRILLRMGYKEIIRIPDDRGQGIDTVFFAKDF